MKLLIFPTLLLCFFTNSSFSQSRFLVLPNTYEYRYDEFNHIAIVSEGYNGLHHLIIVKNMTTGRLDTTLENIEAGISPFKTPYFGFIDSTHFVVIIESFHKPYPARYIVYTILPKGIEVYAENIITNDAHYTYNSGYYDRARKGRYDYRVIDLTHIEIYDRGRWIAVVDFDLKQKKLLRTEILLE